MGLILCERYDLNPSACTYVGDMKTDETFAKRCGMKFINAEEFFS
jgi:phosphoglycolate phosphatase-like HAD superfamily hydrolase